MYVFVKIVLIFLSVMSKQKVGVGGGGVARMNTN